MQDPKRGNDIQTTISQVNLEMSEEQKYELTAINIRFKDPILEMAYWRYFFSRPGLLGKTFFCLEILRSTAALALNINSFISPGDEPREVFHVRTTLFYFVRNFLSVLFMITCYLWHSRLHTSGIKGPVSSRQVLLYQWYMGLGITLLNIYFLLIATAGGGKLSSGHIIAVISTFGWPCFCGVRVPQQFLNELCTGLFVIWGVAPWEYHSLLFAFLSAMAIGYHIELTERDNFVKLTHLAEANLAARASHDPFRVSVLADWVFNTAPAQSLNSQSSQTFADPESGQKSPERGSLGLRHRQGSASQLGRWEINYDDLQVSGRVSLEAPHLIGGALMR
jgi:hypothetical protein